MSIAIRLGHESVGNCYLSSTLAPPATLAPMTGAQQRQLIMISVACVPVYLSRMQISGCQPGKFLRHGVRLIG